MAILTGPEIKRLAKPVQVFDLAKGEVVWHDGRVMYVDYVSHPRGEVTKWRVVLTSERNPFVPFDRADDQVALWCDGTDEFVRCGENGERIVIAPFDPKWAGPNSFDVHLGDTLRVYDLPGGVEHWRWVTRGVIDPKNPPPTVEYKPEADGRWLLWPGRGYLGSVVERIESYALVPDIDGRSSTGRYFITLHQTAGRGDDGWGGHFTCEIVVTEPVLVEPGSRAAQIRWTTTVGERDPYRGRYSNQGPAPVASRFHLPDGGAA